MARMLFIYDDLPLLLVKCAITKGYSSISHVSFSILHSTY